MQQIDTKREPKHFAIVTDLHVVEPSQDLRNPATGEPLKTHAAAERLIAAIAAESVPLSGILALGDVADTALNPDRDRAVATAASYEAVGQLFERLNLPLFAIPGNHDQPELFEKIVPSRWDSSKDGVSIHQVYEVTVVGIDLRTGPEATGFLRPETARELERVLEKSTRALLLTHFPFVEFGLEVIDEELSTTNREVLLEIVKRHREKVIGCFNGHLHISAQVTQDGVMSTVVPSSSFAFDLSPGVLPKAPVEFVDMPCGYGLLSISPQGEMAFRSRSSLPRAVAQKHSEEL
jgi:Icc protein